MLKVLCIERGLGNVPKYLEQIFNINNPSLPISKSQGITLLGTIIKEFKPDILMAMCRGTYYAFNLIHKNLWKGPTLLLSPQLSYLSFPEKSPIVIIHGTKDSCQHYKYTKEKVESVYNKKLVKLITIKGDEHELESILNDPAKDLYKYIIMAWKKKYMKKKKKKMVK